MERDFPQYLSAPLTFLWLELDVFVMAVVMFTLALFIGGMFWILTFLMPTGYWFIQKGKPRGYLKHIYYLVGLTTFEGYPTAFETTFNE